jgi:hypothetical protein
MSYQWESPLAWLRDQLAVAQDHLLLTYLNPLIGDLDPDILESNYRSEMEETGYFEQDGQAGGFERTSEVTPQEWLKLHVQDLSPAEQRRTILDIASWLDSDVLQDTFQSEMQADGYFTTLKADAADLA